MKIGLALVRKQADIYRGQGLHQEARQLYSKYSACSTQLDPTTKAMIEKQLQLIDLEMSCVDTAVHPELSADEIEIIKKGWGEAASGVDILVCAQAFMDIGRFGDALKEFRTLMLKGGDYRHLVYSITECLLQIFDPQALSSNLEHYARSLYRDEETAFKFQLSIAVQMLNRSRLDHASALYRHLCTQPTASKKIRSRLAALGTMIQTHSALQAAPAETLKTAEPALQRASGFSKLGSKLKSVCSNIVRSTDRSKGGGSS